MENHKLRSYITEQLHAGIPEKKIREDLMTHGGWHASDLDGIFKTIPTSTATSTPAPIQTESPSPQPTSRKPLFTILLVVLGVCVVGGSAFAYFTYFDQKSPELQDAGKVTNDTDSNQNHTQEINTDTKKIVTEIPDTQQYDHIIEDIPFSFSYPETYCWIPDIVVTIIAPPEVCGGTVNDPMENVFIIRALPEEINTTDDLLKTEYLKNMKNIGSRTIGGYQAIQLEDPDDPNAIIYAFMTNYTFNYDTYPIYNQQQFEESPPSFKYSVVIYSNLSEIAGGKEAEELIINSLTFKQN